MYAAAGGSVPRAVPAVLGAGLLIVAAVFFVLGRRAGARLRTVRAIPTTPCRDVRSSVATGDGRARVELQGVARMPEGVEPSTSVFLKEPRVWYRSVVVGEFEHARAADEDMGPDIARVVVYDHGSENLLAVDDGSGSVLVDPRRAEVHGRLDLDEFDADARSTIAWMAELGVASSAGGPASVGYWRQEWSISDGDSVYVLGTAVERDGRVVVAGQDDAELLITAGTEADVVRWRRDDSVSRYVAGAMAATLGVFFLLTALLLEF